MIDETKVKKFVEEIAEKHEVECNVSNDGEFFYVTCSEEFTPRLVEDMNNLFKLEAYPKDIKDGVLIYEIGIKRLFNEDFRKVTLNKLCENILSLYGIRTNLKGVEYPVSEELEKALEKEILFTKERISKITEEDLSKELMFC